MSAICGFIKIHKLVHKITKTTNHVSIASKWWCFQLVGPSNVWGLSCDFGLSLKRKMQKFQQLCSIFLCHLSLGQWHQSEILKLKFGVVQSLAQDETIAMPSQCLSLEGIWLSDKSFGLHWPDPCNLMFFNFCQRASCATYGRDPCTLLHEWLSADSARSQTMQRHGDDLKSIAQQELTLSTFHATRSLIRLVFVASHLAHCSTMTSLDLQSDRLWAQARCWHSRRSLHVISWARPNDDNDTNIAGAHRQWHRKIVMDGELFRARRRECDIGELN